MDSHTQREGFVFLFSALPPLPNNRQFTKTSVAMEAIFVTLQEESNAFSLDMFFYPILG